MSAPDYPTVPSYGSQSPENDTNDLVTTAQHDLATAGDEVKKQAAAIGDEVKQQAAALGEEAKAQVGEMAEKAKGIASEQKDLLAGHLGGVSEALQNAASELEGRQESGAQYVRMIADGADKLTSTLRDKDVDEILAIAQDFGRKQPAAFLGVAALLGFAASRFVMASASRPADTASSGQSMQSSAASSYVDTPPDYSQTVGGRDAGL